MTGAEEYRSLLQQKKRLVFELLRLSNDLDLSGGSPEQSADRYVDFVAAREALIEQLRDLDGDLSGFSGRQDMPDDTAELRREIQAMGNQVIRLEPGIQRKAHGLSAYFQRRINIVQGQKQEASNRGEYTKGLRYQKNV
jgi:hypothetical protein